MIMIINFDRSGNVHLSFRKESCCATPYSDCMKWNCRRLEIYDCRGVSGLSTRHSMDLFLIALCLECIVATKANFYSNAWNRSIKQTLYEQVVEDMYAVHKIDNHLVRRQIAPDRCVQSYSSQWNAWESLVW